MGGLTKREILARQAIDAWRRRIEQEERWMDNLCKFCEDELLIGRIWAD